MIDIVSAVFEPSTIRVIGVTALWVSAFFMGFAAFAATHDAGLRCPLALIRLVQRVALAAFAISLAYLAAWISTHPEFIPPGPAVVVNVLMVLAYVPSVLRHVIAPPVPRSNSWRRAWSTARRSARARWSAATAWLAEDQRMHGDRRMTAGGR